MVIPLYKYECWMLPILHFDTFRYEEWLEMTNGCLCCSVKSNAVLAMEKLMEKQGKFDYVLIETTGKI